MAYLLHIDTATQVCSVALSKDDTLIGLRESMEANVHSRFLTVFIGALLEESEIAYNQLDAISVSMGPGSYTGLRIGVSAAKGFCYGLDIPLISVPTMKSMAAGALEVFHEKTENGSLLCPMIDARRMEVYTALFNTQLEQLMETDALIIDENSFAEKLSKYKILFFGNGASKTAAILGDHPNVIYPGKFEISSRYMVKLAWQKFRSGDFEDVAYFEPYYLKDFVAGKPRVKGL